MTDKKKRKNPKKEAFVFFAKGAAMGSADIIPGVSGGTIALITGIYQRLIHSISNLKLRHLLAFIRLTVCFPLKEKRKLCMQELLEIDWRFLLPLAGGILSALLLMIRLIPFLLEFHPYPFHSFLFGLISCSLLILFKKFLNRPMEWILLISFAIVFVFLTGNSSESLQNNGDEINLFFLFGGGAIAISAMILPGISGSYILLLLGLYEKILQSARELDILVLLVFFSGVLLGLLSFVHILRFLLSHFSSFTMASLTGMMIGSIHLIWPLQFLPQEKIELSSVGIGLAFFLLGLLLVFSLDYMGKRNHQLLS